jgi:hypothetical protein
VRRPVAIVRRLVERSRGKRLRPARGAGVERGGAAPPSTRERGWGPASSGKYRSLLGSR